MSLPSAKIAWPLKLQSQGTRNRDKVKALLPYGNPISASGTMDTSLLDRASTLCAKTWKPMLSRLSNPANSRITV